MSRFPVGTDHLQTQSDPPPRLDIHVALTTRLARDPALAHRVTALYNRLRALPRRARRRLYRRARLTLAGAALLLALNGGVLGATRAEPVSTIIVADGEVANVNNNKCGLIEAIINARVEDAGLMRPDCTSGNVAGPDIISLPNNGAFTLTEAHNTQFGATGLPVITSSMTIEGHGSTILRSTTANTPAFRILAVDPGVSLTLRNTTLSNGWLSESSQSYKGGGILSYGSLTLAGVTITGNKIDNMDARGGGVFAAGPLTLTDSTISNSRASGEYFARGGGLYIGGSSSATMTGSNIVDNVARSYYGTAGGGIAVVGQVSIVDSTIAGNVNGGDEYGGVGGGVHVSGQATITGSTITNNVVHPYDEGDGGWWPGTGGGLSNNGTLLIVNSTISANTGSIGGGLANLSGNLTVVQSTISGNHARAVVDGGYTYFGDGGGLSSNCSATLRGTILSGNVADDSGPQARFVPSGSCGTTMIINAFNLFGQSNNAGLIGFAPGANDIVPSAGLNAILSPLANNGGPTPTHALPDGSPARDRAPNATCVAAPVNGVDQRGEARNQNGLGNGSNSECDVGAFEAPSLPLECYLLSLIHTGSGSNPIPTLSQSTGCSVNSYHNQEIVQLRADPADGWHVAGWSGTDNDSSTALTNTVAMPDNAHTVTVHYAIDCYTLTRNIQPSGSGEINASPPKSANCPAANQYTLGTSVLLTAEPHTGYRFDGWSGALSGMTNPQSLTMNGSKSVTANFSESIAVARGAFLPSVLHIPLSCFAGPDEDEDNDDVGQATGPLCSGRPYTGLPEDRHDVFFFDTVAGPITVNLSNHVGSSVQLQLHHQAITRNPIAIDPDGTDGYHIAVPNAPAGRYYIVISTERPDPDATTRYTLTAVFP